MNVYELEKRATPGPLSILTGEGERVWVVGGSGENKTAVAVYGKGPWNQKKEANAKLLAHCRNNFMNALDTLQRCWEILDSEYPDHDPRHPSRWLDGKIKELEEVEPCVTTN